MKNAARLEKTSHAGIIRIGFEGISQPHDAWSTPVSIVRLKHPTVQLANSPGDLQNRSAAIFALPPIRSPSRQPSNEIASIPEDFAQFFDFLRCFSRFFVSVFGGFC
jgi:hypothetical protein